MAQREKAKPGARITDDEIRVRLWNLTAGLDDRDERAAAKRFLRRTCRAFVIEDVVKEMSLIDDDDPRVDHEDYGLVD